MSHLPGERPDIAPATRVTAEKSGFGPRRIWGIAALAATGIAAIILAGTLVTIAHPELTGQAGQEPAAPSSAPASSRADTGIGDGTHTVGEDIAAGTYRAVVPAHAQSCYWARLEDPDGNYDNIIANGNAAAGHRVTVTVRPSDTAFTSSDCGDWTRLE